MQFDLLLDNKIYNGELVIGKLVIGDSVEKLGRGLSYYPIIFPT